MCRKAILKSLAVLSVGAFAWTQSAFASVPPGCTGAGVNLKLDIYFADGVTAAAGVELTPCETVLYVSQLCHSGGTSCDLIGGTLTLTLPDDSEVDVTPVGGIEQLSSGECTVPSTNAYVVNVSGSAQTDLEYNGFSFTGAGETQVPVVSSIGVINSVGVCDDGDPCTEDTCDPDVIIDLGGGAFRQGDCVFTPIDCDDEDPCTTDECVDGVCVNTPIDCDDEDPCTIDECVDGVCVNTPIDCDDADACTTDECVDGVCVNTPIDCDDADACTTDECVDGVCVNTPIDCDDADACTTDECVDGVCVNTPIDCDDEDPCTDDSCVDGVCVNEDNGTCGENTGCTPGFWKNCTANWDCFSTTTTIEDVFDIPGCVGVSGSTTLHKALSFTGGSGLTGAAQNLLRAAVAAVLNACSDDVNYPLTTQEVIDQVNEALASCTRATMLTLAGTLDTNNNLGCNDSEGNSIPCNPKDSVTHQ